MSLAFNTVARMTNSVRLHSSKVFSILTLAPPFSIIFPETWLYIEIAGIFLFGLDSLLTEDLYLQYWLRGYSFELSPKRLPSERGKPLRKIQYSMPFCLTRICFHITLKFVAQREQQHIQLFMFSN